jgi:hypothetical protein
MMYRRPDNVTAAGIIICLIAVIGLILSLLAISAQDVQQGGAELLANIVQCAGAVAMLVAGVNVLRGENWARWFYLVVCGLLLCFDLGFYRDHLYAFLPAGTIRAISLTLLFVPSANRYYASGLGKWD